MRSNLENTDPVSSHGFTITKTNGGVAIAIVGRDRIEGNEHELFDHKVQLLANKGFRIIDKSLTIDAAHDPPVCGWILYRELTNGERERIRPIPAPVQDQGAGLP